MLSAPRPHARSAARLGAGPRAWALLLSFVGLLMGGCAAESDPTGGTTGDSSASATGSVSVFLTDYPSDEFDEILLTLQSIRLLGSDGPITIFSGEETIDLKDLENFSDLFVYAEEVPAGSYNKIRLGVGRIQLVRNGADGQPDEIIDAEVPANGKVDLNPRGPFEIREGVNVVIQLDVDAQKSIHVHPTGSGRYQFRPVVFVTITDTVPPVRLARVHGVVTEIFDDDSFELCTTIYMASRNADDASRDRVEGGLGDRHRCITVAYDGATGVFDQNGDPALAAELDIEDELTAVGRFHLVDGNHGYTPLSALHADLTAAMPRFVGPHSHKGGSNGKGKGKDTDSKEKDTDKDTKKDTDKKDTDKKDTDKDTEKDTDGRDTDTDTDTDQDDDDGRPPRPDVDLVFAAYVIEIGPAGTYFTLSGLIETELDNAWEFEFALDSGQGFGSSSSVTALLQDQTRLFTKRGQEVDDREIIPDTLAKIDGVFASTPGSSLYKTALLVLDIEPGVNDVLRGLIVDIDDAQRELIVRVDQTSSVREECVDVPESADLFLLIETGDGTIRARIGFDELAESMGVDIYGTEGTGDGCFEADTLIASPGDAPVGDCSSNADCTNEEFCQPFTDACFARGECQPRPQACPDVVAEVCGCDDVTYANACEAEAAGQSVAAVGACEVQPPGVCGGPKQWECSAAEICLRGNGVCDPTQLGECLPRPQVCALNFDPVCSCDDETFENACLAALAGATVAEIGACGAGPL